MATDLPPEFPDGLAGGEPFVPLLRVAQALGDPVALATWHAALSNLLAVDLPHDLLGLWLYPAEGGSVLLGPEALAQDELTIPLPAPQLEQRQLVLLEEIIRDAGYGSAVCLPIRFGRRDVGLLLAADLHAGRYGEPEILRLTAMARRLAPAFGRMARQWTGGHGPTSSRWQRIAGLVDALAEAAAHGATAERYVAALSRALEPLLPHDRLELLVSDAQVTPHYRLTEHTGGPLWADPSLVVGADLLEPSSLLDAEGRILLPDACRDPRWPRGYFTAAEPAGAELRAVVGARFAAPGGLVGYLLAGSIGPDMYDTDDADLIGRTATLIAAQVAALAGPRAGQVMPRGREEAIPSLLLEVAETLAVATEPREATGRVAEIAARFLPFDTMQFAVRLSEGDRVVLLAPGERRQLPDLPLIPVSGTALGRVVQGELPSAFDLVAGEARLVVPLRVAGRVHGALLFTAAPPAVLNPAHVHSAQQLADVVAPHLELLRRAALLPPPFRPGWKREPRA
ncbi:MAG TPA: GAF domain-containing protein [Gemmatimonadales bacterium]|nr:GAF domain-containing protein [Gemmatimonadales bacterium]